MSQNNTYVDTSYQKLKNCAKMPMYCKYENMQKNGLP